MIFLFGEISTILGWILIVAISIAIIIGLLYLAFYAIATILGIIGVSFGSFKKQYYNTAFEDNKIGTIPFPIKVALLIIVGALLYAWLS